MNLLFRNKLATKYAEIARDSFQEKVRPDGSKFWHNKNSDNRDFWITKMVGEIHRDPIRGERRLLDDDLHNWIVEILDWIEESDVENEGSIHLGYEVSNHVDVMGDYEVIQWFGRSIYNQVMVEEVTTDWHELQDCVSERQAPDVMYLIREGMKKQIIEVKHCIMSALFERVNTEEQSYLENVPVDAHLDNDSMLERDELNQQDF